MTAAGHELQQLDEGHFAFGDNWRDYASTVTETEIAQARAGLVRLLPEEDWRDRTMVDIGCGSGIHSLCALRLGVRSLLALDLDPVSVSTTDALLGEHAPEGADWRVEQASVFTLDPAERGVFDIVYSWGVLHHTGAMWDAVARAAALVAPGGKLVIALYVKTPLCGLWKLEKRIYAHAPRAVQWLIRVPFKGLMMAGDLACGRNPLARIRQDRTGRGMSWHHDVHDWLGGHPYESATEAETLTRVGAMGFRHVSSRNVRYKALGLFGSGCAEYVFERERA